MRSRSLSRSRQSVCKIDVVENNYDTCVYVDNSVDNVDYRWICRVFMTYISD